MDDPMKWIKEIPWCNEPWGNASVSVEAMELVQECARETPGELLVDLKEVIDRSRQFPVSFPIDTVRIEKLIQRRSVERLKRNVESTYPLVHERVVALMANFIVYKRRFGSDIEKALYCDMSIFNLLDRILTKRAVSFMKAQDHYKLLTGEKGVNGWDSIGTKRETPPLVLANCLSYDEVKLSALVSVSSYTECINDGDRSNAGVVRDEHIEQEAVIVGIVGPRFKRRKRMEYEDILVNEDQNYEQNGFGAGETDCYDVAIREWRNMWADFYKTPNYTHEELLQREKPASASGPRALKARWVHTRAGDAYDNCAYHRRLALVADCVLCEADARAAQADRMAYVNVVGAGLGVWKASPHQPQAFVCAWLQRAAELLQRGLLQRVAVLNFAHVDPGQPVRDLFKAKKTEGNDSPRKLFLENVIHPRGGITVQLENRNPSAKLRGAHAGLLPVLTYAWDGNAHPGNEFWLGKLSTSGDPAAACSTQVAELHNAHINPALAPRARGARVATAGGLLPLAAYCRLLLRELAAPAPAPP